MSKKDETIISERAALSYLMREGDFTDVGARAVLAHSRKVSYNGDDYYPLSYIAKRAKAHAAKENPKRKKSHPKKRIASKPKRRAATLKRAVKKRKPLPKRKKKAKPLSDLWLLCANTRDKTYYYVGAGKPFDSVKARAHRFDSYAEASRMARAHLYKMPPAVETVEIKRA